MTIAPVYLDYNAGAPVRPEVAAAVAEALGRTGNPSSVHRFGRLARRALEEARERVAALVGARADQVVFTSCGSEANALALRVRGRRLLVSAVEHDSVRAAAPEAGVLAVDGDGVVDLGALEAALAADPTPALVSVVAANNETGVVQPLAEIGACARAHGALVHTDAVQAVGRLPEAARLAEHVDAITLSAHKLGGPQGVGALVVGDAIAPEPLIRGGGQEMLRRAGTENVAGIVGFGVAAALATAEEAAEQRRQCDLRDALEARARAIAPESLVVAQGARRLANTSAIAMPGVAAETQVMALDLAGVAVSAGAACSSGKVGRSHVLAAMALAPELADCVIRVSLGWASREADIDRFFAAWGTLYRRTRGRGGRARAG